MITKRPITISKEEYLLLRSMKVFIEMHLEDKDYSGRALDRVRLFLRDLDDLEELEDLERLTNNN